jgi:haloacetate dehalogenase
MSEGPLMSSRRAIIKAGLALAALAGPAEAFAAQSLETAARSTTATADYPGEAADRLLFHGFRRTTIETKGLVVNDTMVSGATINTLVGGSGPPLLLIHGHPETHVAWHKVADTLAQRYTVVLTDLRGYGDSSKPEGGPDHVNYSKRVMGEDQVQVMRALGFDHIQAVGHDRGGRVLQFMMLDHPEAVTRGAVLDIAPTDGMYGKTTEEFATRYFWWFFQIQPAPFPERMIGALPEVYLRDHLDVQSKTPGAVTPIAFLEYLRCYTLPGSIHAICEDYRAAATIDRQLLQATNKKIQQPLMAIWGAKGTVGQLFDVVPMWQRDAESVNGRPLPCGHLIEEEDPKGLVEALLPFLEA